MVTVSVIKKELEMRKITLLLTAVFVLSVASLYAQQRVSRDMLELLLHQMYFDHVPENEFNQVFQNFMRSNYPSQNIFTPAEVREITSNFVLSILFNDAVTAKWEKYADAANAKKSEQQAAARQNQPAAQQPQTNQPQEKTGSNTDDRSGWNIAHLDTARNVNYLSNLEKDIILEMNMARSDPKKYAEMYINSNLGAYAKECYEELKNAESRPMLLPKKGLSQAAKDHVADTGPKGVVGHDGIDGSSMSSRINRYGTWGRGASENISYGSNTAREIVLQLLIDDGVESRGHRRNIMNMNTKYVGVATGSHAVYRIMCVQDFAVEYTDR
jgi:uncharacterized protein YkwD